MPNNFDVVDIKPNNSDVSDYKPNNNKIYDFNTQYLETRYVQKGEIMLLVPLITYPVAGTFTNAQRL